MLMGEELSLIATFYSFQPFVTAAHAYSPSRIILIVSDRTTKAIEEDISKVRELYGKVASIEVEKVEDSDLLAIALRTSKLIEGCKGRVIVNVSGGWKLLAQGVLYGCYARPNLVERIVCNDLSSENSLVEIPKLSYGLSSAKRDVLEEIESRKGRSISEISEKLGKTSAMLYQHLKELRELGYVDEKFEITLAGRMALI